MMRDNNDKWSIILAVGIIAIILILIGSVFPFSNDQKTGLILMGVSMLLFLVAGAVFGSSWQIGLALGGIGLIIFFFGLHAFLTAPNPKATSLLPVINQLLLF